MAAEPLLIPVMRGGQRIAPAEANQRADAIAARMGLARLPLRFRQINREAKYPVHLQQGAEGSLEKVRQRVRRFAVK